MRKYLEANIEHNTLNMPKETWLKLRKKGIGGSDASSILNLNPYRSSVNVYMEKIDENIEIKSNMKMILGEKLEEFVAKEFCNQTGKKVRNLNGILRNHKYPYAIANLDKVVVSENAFLECVVTNSYCKKEWSEEVPIHYQIQCYHYMAVTGATHCYVCALIGNEEIKIYNDKNQQVLVDGHGISCRQYDDITEDYSPKQMRIINNVLAFTKDNWQTVDTAIGEIQ